MSDPAFATPFGLAGLLSALQPRVEASPPPPPDLDAIHAAGWQQGFAAGEAAATAATMAALAPLRQSLAAAATALEAACVVEIDRLRPLFATLVERIAATVLGIETAGNNTVLLPLVEAALASVRSDEAPVLRAHPDTLAALQPHLPVLAVAADPGLARDEFAVTGPTFIIETGLSERLADIVAGLA
jgi:flagellar biosynthesis/type III secretory pathway protein FliH